MNSVLSEVEVKSIKATKDCSAVESQLQDVQVSMAVHNQQHWNRTGIIIFPRTESNSISELNPTHFIYYKDLNKCVMKKKKNLSRTGLQVANLFYNNQDQEQTFQLERMMIIRMIMNMLN